MTFAPETSDAVGEPSDVFPARKKRIPDISSKIAQRVEDGLSALQIAQELGVTDSTVRKYARDNGLSIAQRRKVDADGNAVPKITRISEQRRQRLEQVADLYRQGVRSAEIARRLGFTREMIRQDLALMEIVPSAKNQQQVSEIAEQVRALAAEGRVTSEISQLLGISVVRVRGIAEKFEITISRLKPVAHGTMLSYQRGCTCGLCREANSKSARESRERRLAKGIPAHLHGTDTGYRNWQCKCVPCKEAGAATNRNSVTIPGLASVNKNAVWTQEDDALIDDRTLTARELAVRLDRTVSSVNTRRALLKRRSESSGVTQVALLP